MIISGLLAVRAYGVYRFRVMQGAMQYVLKGFNKKIECDEFRSRPEGCGEDSLYRMWHKCQKSTYSHDGRNSYSVYIV